MPSSNGRMPVTAREEEQVVGASLGRYFWVWVALTALTFLTWAVSRIDLGPWNIVIALAIAAFKATLVLLFFMHLRESRGSIPLVGAVTLVLLLVLLTLSITDLTARFQQTVSQPALENGAVK